MNRSRNRWVLLGTAATFLWCFGSGQVHAQDADTGTHGLEEIVVTAQKREQRLQDVPIAVTAISTETLQANRITNVADLSGLAPGLTVMATAGASKVPSFTLRGAVGNGVTAGSDRQVSTYLDGIYLSGSRGGIFELPDIDRIEVLRGPQGTLFGRNATAGAVNISTRDPTGEMGVRAVVTTGNHSQYRFQTSVDLPQIGPFSAYFSYLHSQRHGDVRNTAAGQIWDRRSAAVRNIAKIDRSPRFLGSEDADTFFAAVKFESGDFTTVYKYDRLRADGTPVVSGLVGVNPAGPVGALLTALINSQSFAVPIRADGKRPDAAANGYTVGQPQRAQGHSVTSTYQISDSLSVKNVFGYRTSSIFGAAPLDGASTLIITPTSVPALVGLGFPAAFAATLVGQPFSAISSTAQGRTKQLSDELQFNYSSSFLTATAGALWFNAKDFSNEMLQPPTHSFVVIPGGVILNERIGRNFHETTSTALYAQFEFHVTDQLDLIAGGRYTWDKKESTLTTGPSLTSLIVIPAKVKDSRFNYLLGVNYKPTDDILLYGKYSTAYLGGGSVVGIPYDPETVKAWEAGIKSELFDHRLRANLALFLAKYRNIQQSTSSSTPGYPAYITAVTGDPNRFRFVSTFIIQTGNLTAKGFELDITAAPVDRLTFGGSLGYTHSKISNVPELVLQAQFAREFKLILRPDWTANLWAQYDTPPIGGGDAYVSIRADARWQSDMLLAPSPSDPAYRTFAAGSRETPAYWVVNGRLSLKDLKVGGVETEIALWGRNLANARNATFALNLGVMSANSYVYARSYGLDFLVKF